MEVESVYLNRWAPGKSWIDIQNSRSTLRFWIRAAFARHAATPLVATTRTSGPNRPPVRRRTSRRHHHRLHLTSGHLSDDSRRDQDRGDRYHCDHEDEGEGSATKKLRRTVIDDGFQSTARIEFAGGSASITTLNLSKRK